MKLSTLFFFFCVSIVTYAQAPQGINYQAVARDAAGTVLQNQSLSVRLTIHSNTTSNPIYREVHTVSTNAFGLFTLKIGQPASVLLGNFSAINWGASSHYLEVEINPGSGFITMGTTQLMSVPYALYAEKAGNATSGTPGLNCWDLNGNGVGDPAEDVNGDSFYNALDCQGAQGPAGTPGTNGTNGTPGTNGTNGIACWDLNGNGIGDAGEDTNGDSNFDALDCKGVGFNGLSCWDLNGNGFGDAGEDKNKDGLFDALDCAGAPGTAGTNGVSCWDTNGNGIGDGGEDVNSDGFYDALDCIGAAGTSGTNGTNGLNCWDSNGNGVGDAGEDINSDGFYDALDCIGAAGTPGINGLNCWDTNGNGIGDAGEDLNSDGFFNTLDCSGTGWNLTGNAGTTDGTNFIGTTDNVPFTIRTNNQQSGRIDPLLSNSFLGYLSGKSSTGNQNSALGTNSLYVNTTGGQNTAIGVGALQTNTTGSGNTAVGAFADVSAANLTNATAIGANAVASQSNSMILGNNANIGMGTSTPNANQRLHIVGATSDVVRIESATSPSLLLFTDNTTTNSPRIGAVANDLQVETSSLERMRVTSAGSVGIGTSSPTAKLESFSNAAITQNIGVKGRVAGASNQNFGLYGDATGGNFTVGVFGSGTGGAYAYGVYGSASGASNENWAGYFTSGNVNIQGGLAFGSTPSFGTPGQVLTSAGPGVAPTWSNPSSSLTWNLNGNAGTVDGTNFIGTTDNVPLNIKVNNQKAGRIDPLLNNSFFGYQSGLNISTGSFNSAFGSNSLYSNSTGYQNTSIGRNAMYSNTTGILNSAFGDGSLTSNGAGFKNTATGVNSLSSNTTGNENTAYGNSALQMNVAGSRATAVGGNSMLYANNTNTGFVNTNVAVGFEALRGSTTASTNTGLQNTAVGYQSMLSNSSGTYNSTSGTYSLLNNTTGSANSAFGYQALTANTTGNSNTAIGNNANISNVAGNFSTAIGHQAMYFANNSGTAVNNYNTAVGADALRGFTNPALNTGILNTVIGGQSMIVNTSGSNNSTNGYQAMYNNSTGNNNTAMGIYSLSTNTVGNNNTALGSGADVLSNNLTNATAIGYNAKVGTGNSLVLGGTGTDAVNVGINTTSPTARLDVVGTAKVTGFIMPTSAVPNYVLTSDAAGNGTWQPLPAPAITGGGTNNYAARWTSGNSLAAGALWDNGTNVGVGVAPALYKMHIYDNSSTNPALFVRQDGNGTAIQGNNYLNGTGVLGSAGGTGYGVLARNVSTGPALFAENTGTGYAAIFMGGNVGIGTTSPGATLHLLGKPSVTPLKVENNGAFTVIFKDASQALDQKNWGIMSSTGKLVFSAINDAESAQANHVTFDRTGNVGIGTVSPSQKLEVQGKVKIVDGTQAAGYVLTSDAAGTASWQAASTDPKIGFLAGINATGGQTITGATIVDVVLTNGSSLVFNDGNGYNPGTGEFTAPVNGVYQFNVDLQLTGITVPNVVYDIMLNVGGGANAARLTGTTSPSSPYYGEANLTATVKLPAGTKVKIRAGSTGSTSYTIDRYESSFSGHLIYTY